jgi:predicted permease
MGIRLAVRRLLSRPAYTGLLILIVGAGIGAATTVYSVVDQLLLRPAPFAFADRLVDVFDTNRVTRGGGNNLTPEKIAGWQAQPALFERFEGAMPVQFDVTGDAEPERISGLHVSLGLFSMLGVAPRLGRDFTAGDGRPGGERIAMISEDLWRRRFAADSDALGRVITLNDQPYTIVGVMPRRFRLIAEKESVWLPVDVAANRGDASLGAFYGLGRLARGVAMADAQRMADTIADRMQAATPLARSWDLRIDKKLVASVDPITRTSLFVLLGAVSFVLFITCANVANLFLSHAPLRLREMAICAALGCSRLKLIGGVLAESLVVAGAGGALGLVLANWGVTAMLAAAPASLSFRTTSPVEVDGRVAAVAIALTLVTGLVIGLLPALRGSRPNIEATLRSSAAAARSSFGRAPAALVVFEVAFSVVLLIGAALMARTLANLEAIEPGFEPSGLIAMHVDLPSDRYPTVEARAAFFEAAFERLAGVNGVSATALATGVPPSQGGFSWGAIEGEGRAPLPAETIVPFNSVSPGYFGVLRIPIVAGRTFDPADPSDAAIISRGFAERLWPGESAVGRRFRFGKTSPWRTVIGVAANVESRAAGRERTDLQMYYQLATRSTAPAAPPTGPRRRTYASRLLIVRAIDPLAALPDIKRRLWTIDNNQPIERVALVSDLYAEAFGRQRFVLMLMSVFAAIALALTAAGIFGVLSQVVVRRTREIGIRVALGATPAVVMRQVLSGGLVLTAVGVAAGVAGALSLTRVLETLLFGVTPTDPLSFAAVTVFLGAVALSSCWWPARSATRIEPAVALRVD